MDVLCPHRLLFERRAYYGMEYYVHTHTEETCSLLSSFQTSVDALLQVWASYHPFEKSYSCAVLLDMDKTYRTLHFSSFEKLEALDLIPKLFVLFHLCKLFEHEGKLYRTCMQSFGETFVVNLHTLTGDKHLLQGISSAGIPPYRMINLSMYLQKLANDQGLSEPERIRFLNQTLAKWRSMDVSY